MFLKKAQIKIICKLLFYFQLLSRFSSRPSEKGVQFVVHENILLFPNFFKFITTLCELIYKLTGMKNHPCNAVNMIKYQINLLSH